MPIANYGVLRCQAVAREREVASQTPHFQIKVVDDSGTNFRIAVNVKSQSSPSDLLYLVDDDFHHPITAALPDLSLGWHALPPTAASINLDYVRANLFDPSAMRPLPPELPGPSNDLADVLDGYVSRAIADPAAEVYVFGQRWGPEPTVEDKVFGFLPGNGVHDVHMNQGNDPAFARDDGVWQDGGLVLHFPSASRWVAIFLAFQSQAWHTDDSTGHALSGAPGRPSGTDTPVVQILAAMVNPVGPAPEHESVVILNASPDPVDLTGWTVADRMMHTCPLPAQVLQPGAVLTAPVAPPMQLGNQGGSITVLDAGGLKVHGVAYTAQQAGREGWTIGF